MGNSSKVVGRNNQETVGTIMDTSRMNAHQITMHMNKIRHQQHELTKEQFEKGLIIETIYKRKLKKLINDIKTLKNI